MTLGPIRRVAVTTSTNSDLLTDTGGSSGEVLVADHQTGGRGRFERRWESVPGSSLLFSVRLRPSFPLTGWAWLSPLTGLAVHEAVTARVDDVTLKWPNDVLVAGAKIAGILLESRGDAVVVGVGLNVSQPADALPTPAPGALPPTSLAASGARDLDRDALLEDLLVALSRDYDDLSAAGGDAAASGLLDRYRAACSTLGRSVRVELADGLLLGTAVDVTATGALLVESGGTLREVSAGDVAHLRGNV